MFADKFENKAPAERIFGIQAAAAQQAGQSENAFQIIVKDKYGREEKVLIPRGQSVIVSEGKNGNRFSIVVVPGDGLQSRGDGERGANLLVGYHQDGSPAFQSAIPLRQSDPWGLLGW